MINNNKILTVSYGTFSCTLEGFEDSFGTMKAIAEYFRDLSADDRYFGAEPVQPDAQMLARIAQREISRHVEAREDDGRIVLSAKNTPESAALVASDVVEDVADAVAEAAVAKSEERAAAEGIAPAEPTQDDAPEAVQTNSEKEQQDDAFESSATVTDEDELDTVAAEHTEDDPEQDIVPSLPDAEVEAFFAESAATVVDSTDDENEPVEIEAEADPVQERVKADSIADKLKRIRAVVSQQSDGSAAPDYSEDQHADAASAGPLAEDTTGEVAAKIEAEADTDEAEFGAEKTGIIADTLRDLEDALDADDETELAADQDDDLDDGIESEDDDITAILNRLEREDDEDLSDAMVAYDDTADLDADDEMDDNILSAMDSLVAAQDDDDLDEVEDENLFEGEEELDAELDGADDHAEATAEPQAASKPAAPRTRVLKVKRATLEAAIQSGQLEEYEDDEDDAPEEQAAAQPLRKAPLARRSTLSEEAEADLARELAALEADMAAEKANTDEPAEALEEAVLADDENDADVEDTAEEEAPRPTIRRDADEDLSRLMEETASQMDEPEGATRRDAFAHLRAAVAAKKADEAVGGSVDQEESDEPYRDDLASVVRPRRPVSSAARTQRPAEQRPAPLKLVAEQRIDVADSRSAAPVRPRRVAAVVTPPARQPVDESSSFADFAADAGASKLPDLLEAAAAYLSFVEGHEQFSRPQLMTKVRQVEKENFTREDGLRSFGKLLREGKIEKLKGGRFQASDQIGFKPDARAVG
ncbi:hypothetical protein OS189_00895 [Sulfitobacter sp. F26169L]|uniref:hypothetical protein n=1 Tax=Sulfitobacter sp. F26169L TaxID=2996015 RepID=UPI002260B157|nr:hypothetical protein [Sulfitobacter sp. F26169L]MCX7564897.1 hypothetical protein [Sulfitobacter sp. F26169L]